MQGTSEPKRRAGRRDDAPAEGYLDQDFARFRAERLRSTGRRAAVERAAAVEAADTEDPPPLEPRRVGPSPEAAAAPGAAVADETVALALPRADVERFERYREEVATPLRGNPVLPPAAVREAAAAAGPAAAAADDGGLFFGTTQRERDVARATARAARATLVEGEATPPEVAEAPGAGASGPEGSPAPASAAAEPAAPTRAAPPPLPSREDARRAS